MPAEDVRRYRRPGVMRFAATLALLAQIVGVLIAPTAESYAARSAPAHVEPSGTHLHHSHDPNDCPACIALQLSASSIVVPRTPDAPPRTEHIAPSLGVALGPIVARLRAPGAPRAPPALLAPSA